MKIFLDTADVEKIGKYAAMGLVDGITTNPTIILKSGRRQEEAIKEICKLVDGPVSVEGVEEKEAGMVKDGVKFSSWAKNVVVKLPMTEEGLKAVRALSKKGIRTNVTLVFSPTQALLAAKAGATYVSPFVGRLDDVADDGMELVRKIREIFVNYGYKTQIIAASVRSPLHVAQSALCGCDIATVPPDVMEKMFCHGFTDAGIRKFKEDYEAAGKR
ncbi:MAG: fructose-6-phosphate aldolase [Candidatus Micrarchaeota archaeon]|nr:fructose-6-phosphate aldolase [Candidatus Micrarchaeota archaeon]